MMRLPERIHIEQGAGSVSITDSTGLALQRITTARSGAPVSNDSIPSFSGEWNHGRLQIVREGRRGRITETFSLEEGGRTLVIRTKMESAGPRPSREVKRIYRRMST